MNRMVSLPGMAGLQSRDPFSGDCERAQVSPFCRAVRNTACRAETRSQGIATKKKQTVTGPGTPDLQSRDPFSGDCDWRGAPRAPRPEKATLQSRDPFSGDCDRDVGRHFLQPQGHLQSRDPFSVDCDETPRGARQSTPGLPCRAETRSQGIATIRSIRSQAGHRWTLQSRDPFSGDCDKGFSIRQETVQSRLAEPRPVLRGLRPFYSF